MFAPLHNTNPFYNSGGYSMNSSNIFKKLLLAALVASLSGSAVLAMDDGNQNPFNQQLKEVRAQQHAAWLRQQQQQPVQPQEAQPQQVSDVAPTPVNADVTEVAHAPLSEQRDHNWTPLHFAASAAHEGEAVQRYHMPLRLEVLEVLDAHEHEAVQRYHGFTPLHAVLFAELLYQRRLALLMGHHARAGANSPLQEVPAEILRDICYWVGR